MDVLEEEERKEQKKNETVEGILKLSKNKKFIKNFKNYTINPMPLTPQPVSRSALENRKILQSLAVLDLEI
jgi:hypothetical protein